jgi:hypothetical protein
MKNKKLKMGLVAIAAVAGYCINGNAQSVDSLLDKLVDKGVLSVKEANDLREESDKDFSKAYSAKSGMPDWATALKLNGDMRVRSESFHFDNPAGTDRQRFRYRMRFGAVAALTDDFEAGMRLTSSEAASGGGAGGDPISGNTSMQDNGSKKFIYLDLAYAKWTALRTADWQGSLTLGKMENPFVFSDMVFDGDYTPEGAALSLGYTINDQHSLKATGGAFLMDEISGSSHDPYFYGAQLRLESVWNKHWSSSVGVAALGVLNEDRLNATRSSTFDVTATATNVVSSTSWTVPNQNGGNLRSAVGGLSGSVGNLQNNYTPIVADASVTFTLEEFWHYTAPFPIKLGADFIHNPAADGQNNGYSAGLTFGKAGKKGLWELGYRYKYLEGDAWFEELVDSDFGALYQAGSTRSGNSSGYVAGTNVKGHIVKAAYSPYNALTLGVTAFFTELVRENPAGSDSKTMRVQVDASLKF